MKDVNAMAGNNLSDAHDNPSRSVTFSLAPTAPVAVPMLPLMMPTRELTELHIEENMFEAKKTKNERMEYLRIGVDLVDCSLPYSCGCYCACSY